MKFYNFALYLAVALFMITASPVKAQTNIAVVDDQRILAQSDAARSIKKQLDVVREKYVKEFSAKEKSFIEEQKELIAQRDSLSKDDFAKKAQAHEQKGIAMQRQAQTRKNQLDKASIAAVNQLRQALYEVVQEIAEEKKYDLVITNKDVIIGANDLNITDEVMKRLNKRLKTVKLETDAK